MLENLVSGRNSPRLFSHCHSPLSHRARTHLKLAILISFSGQGGVERMVMNLVREFASRENLQIDLLLIRAQGPHLENVPSNINVIQLRASHTLTSIPELIRYFRRSRPKAMLSLIHI